MPCQKILSPQDVAAQPAYALKYKGVDREHWHYALFTNEHHLNNSNPQRNTIICYKYGTRTHPNNCELVKDTTTKDFLKHHLIQLHAAGGVSYYYKTKLTFLHDEHHSTGEAFMSLLTSRTRAINWGKSRYRAWCTDRNISTARVEVHEVSPEGLSNSYIFKAEELCRQLDISKNRDMSFEYLITPRISAAAMRRIQTTLRCLCMRVRAFPKIDSYLY